MADAILMAGGTGGVSSDDVTASKAQVLQGYKTVTRDSDDEVVEGTFPVTSDADARLELWYYNAHGEDCYVTRIPEGAYIRYYNADGTQSWEPWIRISRQLIKNAINYHPELTIDTVTTCGERGQIPDRGDGAVVSYLQGREDWANRIWVLFKNGWYHRAPWDDGQGHIHEAYVYVTYEQIKNLFGIDASKMLQDYSVAGVQGTIPRWICTTGDVITALGGEGFAWDDTHANRGRGIVVRIPSGSYIQGANWVFLPSPNHLPHNIRKGVNINGTIGTMEDYGAGRVAFRNATFDGVLISGVANKGFILRGIPRFLNFKNTSNGYLGIQDGGMKFLNFYGGNTRQVSAPDVGCVLAHSINLSPFRYIKVGYKVFRFIGDGTAAQPARVSFEIGVAPISNAGGESYNPASNTVLKDIGGTVNSASHVMTSTKTNAGDQSDHSQLYLTLDVSANQGHHFLYFLLGNIIHEYSNGVVSSNVVVNYIEFIN